MADEQDALLRQINEEVRREQLAKLWDKYGVLALGTVAAILLAVFGWRFYQNEMENAARRAGAQFAEAGQLLADKKTADAITAFESIAKTGPSGYAQLARLRLAANARTDGRDQDALNQLKAVADDSSASPLFRSFAKLQIASLKVDSGNFTDVKNQLNDLLNDQSPWRYTARELLGLAAYKAGDYSEARKAYESLLIARDAPQSVAQRAQIAMALITREELKKKADTSPATTPAKPETGKPGNGKASD